MKLNGDYKLVVYSDDEWQFIATDWQDVNYTSHASCAKQFDTVNELTEFMTKEFFGESYTMLYLPC